jgi:thymidylate synthase (FAD)
MENTVMQKIKVLDHGFVQYVSHMGSDLTVVNAARVSFSKESEWDTDHEAKARLDSSGSQYRAEDLRVLSQRDRKLIAYLAKHQHWTPFAHPQITIRIKTPMFVRAQLGKHQVGLVMNEVSRRYVSDDPDIYHPRWRKAPTDGAKQGSSGFMEYNHDLNSANLAFDTAAKEAFATYKHLMKLGVAPEQARGVLPQSTYTEWWWTGSLAAFARVYAQRVDAHAQWECQEYGKAIGAVIAPLFPHSWDALTRKEPHQPA